MPPITSCVGKVEQKEYCVARKDENRYKVPKGTKFYRVKVRPRSPGRESKGKGLSRSSSSSEKNELVVVGGGAPRTTSTGNLTSSFAQTELPQVKEETAKDMIDSGMQASGYKERNISVTEEDEPPTMVTSSGDDSVTGPPDHKQRYTSISEAEDVMVDAVGGGGADEVTLFGNLMNMLSFNSII